MKGLLIVFFALFIDGLQAFISLSLAGFVSGFGTVVQIIPYVGTLVGTSIWASGIVLGFIFSVSISLSMGMALLLMLGMEGAFYPKTVFIGFFGEVAPGFSALPMWTALTIMCLLRKNKENGGTMGGVVSTALALAPGGFRAGLIQNTAQTVVPQRTAVVEEQNNQSVVKNTPQTPQLQRIRSVDGITALPKRA